MDSAKNMARRICALETELAFIKATHRAEIDTLKSLVNDLLLSRPYNHHKSPLTPDSSFEPDGVVSGNLIDTDHPEQLPASAAVLARTPTRTQLPPSPLSDHHSKPAPTAPTPVVGDSDSPDDHVARVHSWLNQKSSDEPRIELYPRVHPVPPPPRFVSGRSSPSDSPATAAPSISTEFSSLDEHPKRDPITKPSSAKKPVLIARPVHGGSIVGHGPSVLAVSQQDCGKQQQGPESSKGPLHDTEIVNARADHIRSALAKIALSSACPTGVDSKRVIHHDVTPSTTLQPYRRRMVTYSDWDASDRESRGGPWPEQGLSY